MLGLRTNIILFDRQINPKGTDSSGEKNIWTDEKSVQLLASSTHSTSTTVIVAAITKRCLYFLTIILDVRRVSAKYK